MAMLMCRACNHQANPRLSRGVKIADLPCPNCGRRALGRAVFTPRGAVVLRAHQGKAAMVKHGRCHYCSRSKRICRMTFAATAIVFVGDPHVRVHPAGTLHCVWHRTSPANPLLSCIRAGAGIS